MSLEDKRVLLIAYLKSKVDDQEWHAVWDAAVDLAILDGQIADRAKAGNAGA